MNKNIPKKPYVAILAVLALLISWLVFQNFKYQLETLAQTSQTLLASQLKGPIEQGDYASIANLLQQATSKLTWACIKASRSATEIYSETHDSCESDWRTKEIRIGNSGNDQVAIIIFLRLGYEVERRFFLLELALLITIISFITLLIAREREISALNKTLSDLSLQFAHDIRSPLAVLNRLTKNPLSEVEHRDLLATVTQRIQGIADGLLHESSNASHVQSIINSSTLIKDLIRVKEVEFPEVRILLAEELPTNLEPKIPSNDLFRILSNLINNAVESGSTKVEISVTQANEKFEIAIKDDGAGIEPEVLAKLQKSEIISTKNKGHGLGLAGARKILSNYGAKLEINNNPPRGTEIKITLALAPIGRYVLLDDDAMVIKLWTIAAKRAQLPFDAFNTWSALLQQSKNLTGTNIYVDINLTEKISWNELTDRIEKIKLSVPKNIYLCTGLLESQIPENIQKLVSGIRDKTPPF